MRLSRILDFFFIWTYITLLKTSKQTSQPSTHFKADQRWQSSPQGDLLQPFPKKSLTGKTDKYIWKGFSSLSKKKGLSEPFSVLSTNSLWIPVILWKAAGLYMAQSSSFMDQNMTMAWQKMPAVNHFPNTLIFNSVGSWIR